MTGLQKVIAALTLVFLAVFFHLLFCDWETGQTTDPVQRALRDARVVVPTGPDTGIHARSSSTYTIDAILGFALPVALIAAGLFILVGPRRAGPLHDPPVSKNRPPTSNAH